MAIGISFLFIGVTVTSSINTRVVKASLEDTIKEITKIPQQSSRFLKDNEIHRHPILFSFVSMILWFRLVRGCWWLIHSMKIFGDEITMRPLVLLRSWWLFQRGLNWLLFWIVLSAVLGWDWDVKTLLTYPF